MWPNDIFKILDKIVEICSIYQIFDVFDKVFIALVSTLAGEEKNYQTFFYVHLKVLIRQYSPSVVLFDKQRALSINYQVF